MHRWLRRVAVEASSILQGGEICLLDVELVTCFTLQGLM